MFRINTNFIRISLLLIAILFVLMIPLTIAQAASPTAGSETNTFPNLSEIWAVIEGRLVVLLILTVFDLLFGVILSLIAKDFKWEFLLHYLNTDILPILAWMATAVIGQIPAEFIPKETLPIFEYAVYATVFLSIAASLYGHFQKIGVLSAGGIKEPPQ
jgi:hypothetical protein